MKMKHKKSSKDIEITSLILKPLNEHENMNWTWEYYRPPAHLSADSFTSCSVFHTNHGKDAKFLPHILISCSTDFTS